MICLECEAAIGRKSIAKHIYDVHGDANIRLDHNKLSQALENLQAKESFDLANIPRHCPQIEGLAFHPDAYICSICQHIRGNLISIKQHHFDTHKNITLPLSWTRVAAQQLHHQNRTPYFQVIPSHIRSKDENANTRFFHSLHKDRQKAVAAFDMSKIDPRQVSMWLNVTKWHILVAPYDHQHLISLVQMPTKSETELDILAKSVGIYTRKADQVMDTLSHLALCIINTPEPP